MDCVNTTPFLAIDQAQKPPSTSTGAGDTAPHTPMCRVIIADQTGARETHAALLASEGRTLIICQTTPKRNWRSIILRTSPRRGADWSWQRAAQYYPKSETHLIAPAITHSHDAAHDDSGARHGW